MTVANRTDFVNVRGRKTQLLVGGEGPPLLYLHSAAGETDWTAWHDALGRHYTVYAPAHPGFALSEGLEEIEDIHDLVWHTVDLLDTVGLGPVPVVGFSLGAWLAVELAILRPALVKRLVLIDAAGLHLDEAPIAEMFVEDFDRLRRLIFHDPNSSAAREFFPSTRDDPRLLLWLRAARPRPASPGIPTCTIRNCRCTCTASPARRSCCGATTTASSRRHMASSMLSTFAGRGWRCSVPADT